MSEASAAQRTTQQTPRDGNGNGNGSGNSTPDPEISLNDLTKTYAQIYRPPPAPAQTAMAAQPQQP